MVEFRGLPAWGFAAVIIYITRVYSARWIGSFVSSSFIAARIELLNFAENRARVSEGVSKCGESATRVWFLFIEFDD